MAKRTPNNWYRAFTYPAAAAVKPVCSANRALAGVVLPARFVAQELPPSPVLCAALVQQPVVPCQRLNEHLIVQQWLIVLQ